MDYAEQLPPTQVAMQLTGVYQGIQTNFKQAQIKAR